MKKIISSVLMLFVTFVFLGCESASIKKESTKVYRIGDVGPGGGLVFYDKGEFSDGWRYLEAQTKTIIITIWGCASQSVPEAQGTSIGSGKSNSQAIISNCGKERVAAIRCAEFRGGGKSDWFLPSKDELNLMITNLRIYNVTSWSSTESSVDTALFGFWDNETNTVKFEQIKKNKVNQVKVIRAF